MTDSGLRAEINDIADYVYEGDDYDATVLIALQLARDLVDVQDDWTDDQKARLVLERVQWMLNVFSGLDLLPATRTTMELLWPLLVGLHHGQQQGNA